ncbi:hypothetical protein K458DRAFT_392229 [Lentithecium fluviatile CBS 122367]|uniref:Uncharacterized protein n=1 Tax=Lentithecium fluviatile CBS 122367 TaxID=1168545 RepID=A0A6G1IST4_9PLEO|nr:hypothetical protein K458DRAFT_392229 [Lentithecium fluviatile CBS 122367]
MAYLENVTHKASLQYATALDDYRSAQPLYVASITLLAIDTVFIALFYVSHYCNRSTVEWRLLLCMPLAYLFNMILNIIVKYPQAFLPYTIKYTNMTCSTAVLVRYHRYTGPKAPVLDLATIIHGTKLLKAAEYIYVGAVISIVTCILRLRAVFSDHKDFSLNSALWTILEPFVYFIAAVLSAMSHLKRRWWNKTGVATHIESSLNRSRSIKGTKR